MTNHHDIWIESGSIRFGPVYVEGAISGHTNASSGQKDQHEFLQKHDNKTRKLWFLWPQALTKVTPERVGKCGCIGGCNFFGLNSNGLNFFEPARSDIAERKNIAIPVLRDPIADPGYGQSVLHEHQFVVHGYSGFGIYLEQLLPLNWPNTCQEPKMLPECPDYRTHKSSSSHNSADTPKHPKYHRSFSGKHGTPVSNGTASRKRSISTTLDGGRKVKSSAKGSYTRLHSGATSDPVNPLSLEDKLLGKASSLMEVPTGSEHTAAATTASEASGTKSTIVRTESLISDVLSFYSLDGDDNSSKVSFGLSSPKSLRSLSSRCKLSNASPTSTQYDTAPCSEVNSPTSSQFESATTSGAFASPTTSQYETASMGRNSSSMSFDTPTLQPDSPVNLDALEEEDGFDHDDDDDDTISRAASSGSFISAVSEHEDLGLVNLHMQVNKPITDSPLLMSSYISHLTQLRCSHWNDPAAILSHEQTTSKRFTPEYDMLEEGFSVINMRDKILDGGANEDPDDENLNGFDWDSQQTATESNERSEFVSSLSDSNTSKTTIIVKFKGSIDIICCPIVLESLEKTLDSLVKTFQGLHPISVVNHLHSQSVDRVESRNTLKKEKSLDLQEKLIVEARDSKVKEKDSAAAAAAASSLPSDTLRYTTQSLSFPCTLSFSCFARRYLNFYPQYPTRLDFMFHMRVFFPPRILLT